MQDVVERVIGALQLQASQKQVVISSDISPHAIPLVEADYALLQQALHNLVENAVIYTEPRGKVTVRVEPDKDQMVFFGLSIPGLGLPPSTFPAYSKNSTVGVKKKPRSARAPVWVWRSSNRLPSVTKAGCGWKASLARAALSTGNSLPPAKGGKPE